MSIRDFHSQFVSDGERSSLFAALRRLSLVEELRNVIAYADAGWPRWDTEPAVPPPAGRI